MHQSSDRVSGKRFVAWSELDFYCMGGDAWSGMRMGIPFPAPSLSVSVDEPSGDRYFCNLVFFHFQKRFSAVGMAFMEKAFCRGNERNVFRSLQCTSNSGNLYNTKSVEISFPAGLEFFFCYVSGDFAVYQYFVDPREKGPSVA